jgi:alpha-1,2-mannosyltransferase
VTAVVFCSYALWWVPHGAGRLELTQNAAQMALSALYPLTALAALFTLLTPWRTNRSA